MESCKLNSDNIFKDYNDVVTIKELQKMLRIGKNVSYKLIQENKINHFRINNKIFIPKQSVIDFLLGAEIINAS